MKTLISKGVKIPEEVAVCGYNNLIIAICCTPELTTVDSKVEAVSSGAVKILCDVLEGRNVSSRTMIQPDIIIRQSSKKILNEKGVMYEKIYE
jgi:LacI family transcriptional regulator